MPTPLNRKSTIDEIRARFDRDVERFSTLETGQVATIDAPLAMELITRAAIAATPRIDHVLDIGCGAGNNTIRLRQECGADFAADLVDLSIPMLDRARDRVAAVNGGSVRCIAGDFRDVDLPEGRYDVILAAAVLHHLRDDADWRSAFAKLHVLTAPGGSVWITDLVAHETGAVHDMMWARYGDYLESVGGGAYRDEVFAYIDREDSPRPVTWQLDLLREVGFGGVEIVHKNSCFAAFGAVKARERSSY
ncbi:MAG: SAM-dependent methyltransferase [Phycisphaeraceae bacterium]|nr:SAM-dependent methyltransferase [Phycisphaeraceae bacterium]